jgi:hypothetical protein
MEMSWKDKLMKVDWFKNTNLLVGGFGWALVFVALIITMIGTAHYLALHTEFHELAWRILLFGGFGIGLIYVFYLLEFLRINLCKGGKQ